jgi:hypothetical protein
MNRPQGAKVKRPGERSVMIRTERGVGESPAGFVRGNPSRRADPASGNFDDIETRRLLTTRVLFFEKHPEPDTDAFNGGSHHFAVGHYRLAGIGEIKFDGDLLSREQMLAGVDENASGADVFDRCLKGAIHGPAFGNQQVAGFDFFAGVFSSFQIPASPVGDKMAVHIDTVLVHHLLPSFALISNCSAWSCNLPAELLTD